MGRIGIFGGTFDPPHLGHLILASEVRYQLNLDRLLWVLTPSPPHKPGRPITPVEHRLAMVRAAIADAPEFELSTVESDRPRSSSTTMVPVARSSNRAPSRRFTSSGVRERAGSALTSKNSRGQ